MALSRGAFLRRIRFILKPGRALPKRLGRALLSTTVLAGFAVVALVLAVPLGDLVPLPDVLAQRDQANTFMVYGSVRDTAGRPMTDVEIVVYAGAGTLHLTGRGKTMDDGSFAVSFGPGMVSLSTDPETGKSAPSGSVGLQAATVRAQKEGFYDTNLCRQGDLRMADTLPGDGSWNATAENTVLPNQPFHLSFVMAPAARISGRLLDAEGKPLANTKITVAGDQLPPSQNVLTSSETDAEGRFNVNPVPLFPFWFEVAGNHSKTIPFRNLGEYEIVLSYREGAEPALAVESVTRLSASKRNWGPEQATGAPDTHEAGDIPTAWASSTQDDQAEWLRLTYGEKVMPVALQIHETYNPGAVNKVTTHIEGVEIVMWEGTDPTPPGSGKGISNIPLNLDAALDTVTVYLDSPRVRGWNEIDAVGLIDASGAAHWARAAIASSTYAERVSAWPPEAPVQDVPVSRKRSWGPEQATGAPDTRSAGDVPTAWASLTQDDQPEWLRLTYETPVVPVAVQIIETYNPGAVTRVMAFDGEEEFLLWEGEDPTPVGSRRGVSRIPVTTTRAVQRVTIHLDSPRVRGWNEIDAVGLEDASGAVQFAQSAEASSTYAEPAPRSPGATDTEQVVEPDLAPFDTTSAPEVAFRSHVGERYTGKRSLGGSGHAVLFDTDGEGWYLSGVQIAASRYGTPEPPAENFHVYILDKTFQVIRDVELPYATFERGPLRWYTLPIPDVYVPTVFHVALDFDPHRTKGVYLGLANGTPGETHSFRGLPEKGFEPLDAGTEWMVQVYLTRGSR